MHASSRAHIPIVTQSSGSPYFLRNARRSASGILRKGSEPLIITRIFSGLTPICTRFSAAAPATATLVCDSIRSTLPVSLRTKGSCRIAGTGKAQCRVCTRSGTPASRAATLPLRHPWQLTTSGRRRRNSRHMEKTPHTRKEASAHPLTSRTGTPMAANSGQRRLFSGNSTTLSNSRLSVCRNRLTSRTPAPPMLVSLMISATFIFKPLFPLDAVILPEKGRKHTGSGSNFVGAKRIRFSRFCGVRGGDGLVNYKRRGKLFWRKVFPEPLSKDFETRVRGYVDPEFYRCGSWQNWSVRSPIGDPDLRSP